MCRVSPGLASIAVVLNFMSSPPLISTVRPAPAAFFAAGAAGFAAWPAGLAGAACAAIGATEVAASAAAMDRVQRSRIIDDPYRVTIS